MKPTGFVDEDRRAVGVFHCDHAKQPIIPPTEANDEFDRCARQAANHLRLERGYGAAAANRQEFGQRRRVGPPHRVDDQQVRPQPRARRQQGRKINSTFEACGQRNSR